MNKGNNVRIYGKPPCTCAVLHGGPGAPGYMAPVAKKLSELTGTLEPMQTSYSLEGQIEELENQLKANTDLPVILVGSSWGAVLALFLAARKPDLVKKLILVGCAVFDAENSARIAGIRYSRLNEKQRKRFDQLQDRLKTASAGEQDAILAELGDLFSVSDDYDLLEGCEDKINVNFEQYSRVWSDFVKLRDRPGYLKNEFSNIRCPVVVIHGDYDPHPIDGIRPFLESCIDDIRFYILPKCGHYPWKEKHAHQTFYQILEKEITTAK